MLSPFGTMPGSQCSDAVVERELPLVDQLEDDGGDERLRDAPDPETITDSHRRLLLQVGIAARQLHRATLTTDEYHRPQELLRRQEPSRPFAAPGRGWLLKPGLRRSWQRDRSANTTLAASPNRPASPLQRKQLGRRVHLGTGARASDDGRRGRGEAARCRHRRGRPWRANGGPDLDQTGPVRLDIGCPRLAVGGSPP